MVLHGVAWCVCVCVCVCVCAQVTCVHLGTSVGFYSGNVLELLDDVAALKPHVFVSVPRLWNRIYDKVRQALRCVRCSSTVLASV